MSAFTERLNKCIKESGMSKNRLIETCHVNRATFFQCMNGKRLPTEELLENLIRALQLTPGEEAEVKRLYHVAQIGEPVYQNRQCAKKCLETVAALSRVPVTQFLQFQGHAEQLSNTLLIQGENQVFQQLCYMIQAEMLRPKPRIDMFMPQRHSAFFEYLKALFRNSDEKELRLRQLIQFSNKKRDKTKESLEFYDSILFFLAANCEGYEAYYYYAETDFADSIGILYPYTLATSTAMFVLNETMDKGILSSDRAVLDAYQVQFEAALTKTHQFHTPFKGTRQIESYILGTLTEGSNGYQYFATPFFAPYLSFDMVEKYCPAHEVDAILEYILDYHNSRRRRGCITSFCSERGLMEFARTGIIGEHPIDLIMPLDVEDRRKVLEQILYSPPKWTQMYLMDESKVAVSDEFVFFLSEGLRISTYRKKLPKLRMFCFEEQNLLEAFGDFFASLPESEYVLPHSELERVLRAAIDSCGGQPSDSVDLRNRLSEGR